MKIRVLLAAAATLALAACADSPTGTRSPITPAARSSDDITCYSGYHIATRADGTQYCEADATQMSFAAPDSSAM